MKSISLTETEINHIKEMYSQELERLQKRTAEISAILKKINTEEESVSKATQKEAKVKQEKVTKPETKVGRSGKKPTKAVKEDIKELAASVEVKPKGKRGRPAKQNAETKEVQAIDVKPVAKRGRKPKDTVAKDLSTPKEPAKRGRKPKAKEASAVESKPAKAVKTVKQKKTKAKTAEAPKKRGRKKSDSSKKTGWTTSILEIIEQAGKVLTSRQIIDKIMADQKIADKNRNKTRSIVTGSLSDLKLETKRIKSLTIPGQKAELYGLNEWFDAEGKILEQHQN